ncbi:MAG: VWA domain-containing protein [Chitinophagales bacterium]|nr:VWA domain-containing protein [Bacteroidota bacterium]MBK8683027.1 VWA domain-containing protein [Bacteroidota bacterium]
MEFENIQYLYLLAVIPVLLVLYYLLLRWRKKSIQSIGDSSLVMQMMSRYSMKRKTLKFVLLCLALISFAIALANIRMGSKREKVKAEGSEVIICFDVSRSMLAEDVKPDRLTRAKILASQIIEKLEGNKIALIVFAGKSYVQMPLTVDTRAALMYLNTVNTDMVQVQGTDIVAALENAQTTFANGTEESNINKKNKAVIIITDGENHDSDALQMATKMAANNIKIITVGVGSTAGAPIPVKAGSNTSDFKKDGDGNIILTKMNEGMLREMAVSGGGIYVNLEQGRTAVNDIEKEIASLEKDEANQFEYTDYAYHFQLFLAIGIFLLALEFFISDRRAGWFSRFNIFEEGGNDA